MAFMNEFVKMGEHDFCCRKHGRREENLKYIQNKTQRGHSILTITLNVYTHLLNPVNQDAACRFENMLFENYEVLAGWSSPM